MHRGRKSALKEAASAEHKAQKARKAPKKVLAFYKDLLGNIGLEEDE
jgi:hypothetical protein